MSNFAFIQADFPSLYGDSLEAEKLTFVSSTASTILCRQQAVNFQEVVSLAVPEAETRRRYIDLTLAGCGWDDLRELEYEAPDNLLQQWF